MDFFGMFRKKKENTDTKKFDLGLLGLEKGGFVDYNLHSYKVEKKSRYEEEGESNLEWHLVNQSDGSHCYLSHEKEDGKEYWTISKDLPGDKIPQSTMSLFISDNAPSTIELEGKTYHLDYSGACYFYPDHNGADRQEMIYWEFEDRSGEHTLTVEQWGEHDFEIFQGKYVEETDFYNIIQGS